MPKSAKGTWVNRYGPDRSLRRGRRPPPPLLAFLDRRMTPQGLLRTFDHRHVHHLAVDRDRTAPGGGCFRVRVDDPTRGRDLLGARAELGIEDRHLARMHHRRAEESE